MTILLSAGNRVPAPETFDSWCAIGEIGEVPDSKRRLTNIELLLKAAYDGISEMWFKLATDLAKEQTAVFAHAPMCAANSSDMGVMLAWTQLANTLSKSSQRILVLCNDPWMFRHLCENVATVEILSPAPSFGLKPTRLFVRGVLARSKAAIRFAIAHIIACGDRRRCPKGASTLLVYSHPGTMSNGMDGYFGALMNKIPNLIRLLHVDRKIGGEEDVPADGRTFRLDAWGGLAKLFSLPFARWRPTPNTGSKANHWLVRRAEALEGSTGQAAAIRWQQICQEGFLQSAAPRTIVWPWENHGWERSLVLAARKLGVRTIGYQHATIARQEWNYSPKSYPPGENLAPNDIFCAGPYFRGELIDIGHDKKKMRIAGFLRGIQSDSLPYDPYAPILVALPLDRRIAAQILDAVRPMAQAGRKFVIKAHPKSSPLGVSEELFSFSNYALNEQGPLAAVIFAATTVGLEALLGGLPVIQFIPSDIVAMDVIPQMMDVVRDRKSVV